LERTKYTRVPVISKVGGDASRGSDRVIASTHELQCEQSHWNPVELKNESTRVLNSSPVRLSSCAITNSHELKINSIQEQFPQQVYIFLYFVFCVLCSASVVFVFLIINLQYLLYICLQPLKCVRLTCTDLIKGNLLTYLLTYLFTIGIPSSYMASDRLCL